MLNLPGELSALAAYDQFILWKLVPVPNDKPKKLPVDHRTLQVFKKDDGWQQDSNAWTSATNAIYLAGLCGSEYGVGFYFNADDPFYFVDLDNCLLPDNQTWSPVATTVMNCLPGAAIEISQSGRGLHIIGKGQTPEHGCKNVPLGLELYTEGRFVALTGEGVIGDANTDSSLHLPHLVNTYFPPKSYNKDQKWTTEPVPEWNGT